MSVLPLVYQVAVDVLPLVEDREAAVGDRAPGGPEASHSYWPAALLTCWALWQPGHTCWPFNLLEHLEVLSSEEWPELTLHSGQVAEAAEISWAGAGAGGKGRLNGVGARNCRDGGGGGGDQSSIGGRYCLWRSSRLASTSRPLYSSQNHS